MCHRCKNAFPGGVFFEHEGAPYCKRHHLELFCAACGKCGEPVEIGVTLEGKTYHSQHFVCDDCGESVRRGELVAWHCPVLSSRYPRSRALTTATFALCCGAGVVLVVCCR